VRSERVKSEQTRKAWKKNRGRRGRSFLGSVSISRSFRVSFRNFFSFFSHLGTGQVGAGGVAAGRRRTVRGRGGR